MLKYWREILIGALFIFSFFSVRSCKENENNVTLLNNVNDSSFRVTKYYIDKNGDLVGQIKTNEVTIKQLKENHDALGIKYNKLEKKVSNLNNLVAHWQGKASMRDTVYAQLYDTVYVNNGIQVLGKKFEWSNKYLTLNGLMHDNQISIGYEYEIDFSLTAYRKRQGFLKPKQLVTDIYFSDPSFKFREFRGLVVNENKKWYEGKVVSITLGFIAGFYLGKK